MTPKITLGLFLACCFLMLSSCTGSSERELREKLRRPLSAPTPTLSRNATATKQYREIELAYNETFTRRLEELVSTAFERQLEEFEENELGFFASYGHMYDYLFLSEKELQDNWQVKSAKYFHAIDIETKAADLYEEYLTDVKNIRSNFHKSQQKMNLLQYEKLNLPQEEIYLGSLQSHSRNNLLIEFGVDGAIWLLVLGIVALLSLVITVPSQGKSILMVLLSLIASYILTSYNDDALLDSIREQHTETPIDYTTILKTLNENTYDFYGK